MDKCKKCDCEIMILKVSGPHTGKYCAACNTWFEWVKVDKTSKSSEKYKNEWLENQPATDKQIEYLKALGHKGEVKNKLHASELISRYKK